MQRKSSLKGVRLGIAVLLASLAGQTMAETFVIDGTATLCTTTCAGFDSLAVGSLLDGGVAIDVGASDTFAPADVGDFSFLVFDPATAVEPFDGTNPTTANPLPVNAAVAVVEATGFGTDATGGTTDAAGELASGQILFRFTVSPFSDNSAWVVMDVGTGTAQVCLFYAASGCIPGATESVVFTGQLAKAAPGSLTAYSQNFDGLNKDDPDALLNDGWTVFGNVFDSGGNFKFGYGPFGAPNGGSGFSAIVDDQGGPSQGTQQLSIYNDYNCCQPSDGHFNGTDLVESNVFQEQIIGLSDVGTTWTFSFDAKKGNLADSSTALAFIKTLDPFNSFILSTDPFLSVDMTSISADWNRYNISVDITANLVGHILQFGYASNATNFEPSGIVYDNNDFFLGLPDSDGDGVSDDVDNCTLAANAGQQDADGDGHGNACDPDLDQTCFVNFGDLTLFKASFLSADPVADLDSSGFVNFADLSIVKAFFLQPPGPSAPGALCN